jgi:NAD(P)-dependent dehydrogenase (short-subunit alcohol dehydrogenase family)
MTTGIDTWRRVQEINLTSVYSCCKYVLPHMQRQGKGSIINTASFVAVLGAATSQISYTASKGGVLAMSRELGVQFARQGIRVNALCPGPVNTPLLRELFAADPERAARRLVHVPMGRFAEPEEVSVAPRSRLSAVLGRTEAAVPTHHHQAIDRLGTGLVATAWTDDGVIEAAEFQQSKEGSPTAPFMLAVQWHPEAGDDPSLFTSLIAAAC